MNPATLEAAVALAEAVKAGVGQAADVRVAVCPPFVYLQPVDAVLAGSPIGLGAQNMHCEAEGRLHRRDLRRRCSSTSAARTSSSATASGGTAWARPTRRSTSKLHAALAAGLIPIVCVGETLEEREAEPDRGASSPASSTGSLAGLVARADGRRRARLRAGLGDRHRPDRHARAGPGGPRLHPQAGSPRRSAKRRPARVVVQYGGSVKPDNAGELLGLPDIDGALVGGASLKAADFLGIIQAARDVTASGKA